MLREDRFPNQRSLSSSGGEGGAAGSGLPHHCASLSPAELAEGMRCESRAPGVPRTSLECRRFLTGGVTHFRSRHGVARQTSEGRVLAVESFSRRRGSLRQAPWGSTAFEQRRGAVRKRRASAWAPNTCSKCSARKGNRFSRMHVERMRRGRALHATTRCTTCSPGRESILSCWGILDPSVPLRCIVVKRIYTKLSLLRYPVDNLVYCPLDTIQS